MPSEIIDKYITSNQSASAFTSVVEKIKMYFADGAWLDIALPIVINIVLALIIYVLGVWLIRKVLVLIDKLMLVKGFDVALRGFLHTILSVVMRFVVAMVAIEQLGIDTTSLLALLGAAGLAVGLALKDSLSNFASGVLLILLKPFKIGDFVEIAGVSATVEKISIFDTVLKTGDNREVIMPNSRIYGDAIINYTSQVNRRVDLIIGVSYEDDLKKVRGLIKQVIDSDERILKDPEPVIAVAELADSSVNFVVRAWVKTPDYWVVRWHLLETIKITFDENDVSIPFPQRTLHMAKTDS
jgi:small conductance mechanosensitive channel